MKSPNLVYLLSSFWRRNLYVACTELGKACIIVSQAIPVVVATGRCRASALAKLSESKLDWSSKSGVFQNGALVYVDGVLVRELTVELELVSKLCALFSEREDILVAVCVQDEVLVPVLSEVSTFLHFKYADPYPRACGGYAEMLAVITREVNGRIFLVNETHLCLHSRV